MSNSEFRCTCCPYGWLSAISIVLVYGAVGLITVASYSCHFYTITDVMFDSTLLLSSSSSPSSFERQQTVGVGLWRLERVGSTGSHNVQCEDWSHRSALDRQDLDASMRFARFASLATVFGGLALSFVLVGVTCCTYPTWVLRGMSWLCFTGGAFSILTLVALSSHFCQDAEECELSFAGVLAIFAFVIWTCSGLLLFQLKDKRASQSRSPSTPRQVHADSVVAQSAGAEEITESSFHLAGSKVLVDTNVVPDEDSTVTEDASIAVHDSIPQAFDDQDEKLPLDEVDLTAP